MKIIEKARPESSAVATPNGYHTNGSMNGSTARTTATTRTTAWELPKLILPLPVRRQPARKRLRPLPHYPAVVEYVYNSRFATGSQIQQRFHDFLRTQRTAQYQLAGLVQSGFLRTAPVRSTSPNFPFVYSTTRRGINLVRQEYAKHGFNWQANATEEGRKRGLGIDCILHELFITEFELAIHATVEKRPDLKCLFTERRYFRRNRRLEIVERGTTRKIVPDTGVLIHVNPPGTANGSSDSATPLLHFVELDNGTMPLDRIAEKFRRYAAWAESDAGQNYLTSLHRRYGEAIRQPSFRLVIIAHASHRPGGDLSRLVDLFAQTLELPTAMRDRIWLTTADALQIHQYDELPLDAAIWLRPRDARAWLAEHLKRIHSANLTTPQKLALARRFVRERLETLPRHPLFPYCPQ